MLSFASWSCNGAGIAGAVQQLQMHETLPLVASVGLDRFLRVHDVTTRSLVKKVRGGRGVSRPARLAAWLTRTLAFYPQACVPVRRCT